MSTTIPYSPSLVLGSIVEPAAMDNLLAISATQTPIDAAQETLNSFIAMKRSLEMTVQELINMGLDPKDLLKKIEEVGADVDKAATAYATVRLEQELKLQPLRAKMQIVNANVESPIDYNRTQIKTMALAADSLKMDAQFFTFDDNAENDSDTLSNIKSYVSAATSFLGQGVSFDMAKTAVNQVEKQRQMHKISGTLVLTATCTHKEAQVLAPFCLDVDKAIRVHESMENDGILWGEDHRPVIREVGIPVVRSRLTAHADQFRLEWWMQIDGVGHGNQIEGLAPAELALRAAREVALITRMRSGLQPIPGQEDRFWADACQLVSLAVSLDQADKALPLMAVCVDLPGCPLPIWAEYLLVMAQSADATTPACARRMAQLAIQAGDGAHEGWARLCEALYSLYQHHTEQAVEQALGGVALVRRAAAHARHARALLLASQVLATAGKANEANALWCEAASLVSQSPSPDLVCRMHLLRCELDHLALGQMASGETHPGVDPVACARWLGQAPTTAWLQVLNGLQACARGEWEMCRRQLEVGLKAGERGGSALARLFAHLQLGSLHARSDDQAGLNASVSAVEHLALRQIPMGSAVCLWLLLGTAARLMTHHVADVGDQGQSSYAHYLPLPV